MPHVNFDAKEFVKSRLGQSTEDLSSFYVGNNFSLPVDMEEHLLPPTTPLQVIDVQLIPYAAPLYSEC